jgi:transposase
MESVKARVHRSVSEKRRIVERTVEPGVSVARVAQEEGVNANHIFLWRRSYCTNKLPESIEHFSALLLNKMQPPRNRTKLQGARIKRKLLIWIGYGWPI